LELATLSVEELEALLGKAKEVLKEKRPKPLSVKAKNNRDSVKKHITGVLQSIRVIQDEGAWESLKPEVEGQLSRLALDKYEAEVEQVAPRVVPAGVGQKNKTE